MQAKRLGFITAIPQSVHRGSGCYVGIRTLAEGARAMGHRVELITPEVRTGSFLVDRFLFNHSLRWCRQLDFDAIIGFDADGFALTPARRNVPHIANIKGVLGDALPFEQGFSRASMAIQARWEAQHARQADKVITISEYCKGRLQELYGVRGPISVVPEMIDLARWRLLLQSHPAVSPAGCFTVLCVCRFYSRKRVSLLLRAAHLLRGRVPGLRVRIVGGGPEYAALRMLWRELRLESIVTWVGEVTRTELAREYNRADIFCLPSVQEGFGIVFLEAMAAGKAIVAARAAAVPEVVRNGVLVEPESTEDLAHGIWRLFSSPDLRHMVARRQMQEVEQYDMMRVSRLFLEEVEAVTHEEVALTCKGSG